MSDRQYMLRAISLAKKGLGWTNPNPMVGAVIVKDGKIIGEGYHQRCGEFHAERNAIASLTQSAEGAHMYVTLEPCCHYGRTPPCIDAIIENKIAKVTIGSRDPNPLVSGKGAKILREHGIIVKEDLTKDECDELNQVFFHYITAGKPYVVMKYAMTLDGKIASYKGVSKWITGEKARKHVHLLRGTYSSVMVGIGTVLADNPMLNCRIDGMRQPTRIIADSHLRIPTDCKICKTAKDYPTIVVCAEFDKAKAEILKQLGITVVCLPDENGKTDLLSLMKYLGNEKIDSVLLEGGGTLCEAALRAGIVNHVCAYIAPKLMGGENAKTPVEGIGADTPDLAAGLKNLQISHFGEDLLLEYDVTGGFHDVHRNN